MCKSRSYKLNKKYRRVLAEQHTRKRLADVVGVESTYMAQVSDFGGCMDSGEETILLKQVKFAKSGKALCSHLWIKSKDITNLAQIRLYKGCKVVLRGKAYRYFSYVSHVGKAKKYSLHTIYIEGIAAA